MSDALLGRWVGMSAERLISGYEVAELFGVDVKTVTRWAKAGKLGAIRTPGGRFRYPESQVRALFVDMTQGDRGPVPAQDDPTSSTGSASAG